jgi:hypothetical protein
MGEMGKDWQDGKDGNSPGRSVPIFPILPIPHLLARQHEPHICPRIPRPTVIVSQHGFDPEASPLESMPHLWHRKCSKGQRKIMPRTQSATALDEDLIEDRDLSTAILPYRLD